MARKITLLVLLIIGLHTAGRAQVVLDSVSIYLPIGMDTTCPGEQLTFVAVQSNDTFAPVWYHWYNNTTFSGVSLDTFHTTAPLDGDSVWCNLVYINALGDTDSARSNTIIVHRSTSFPPGVVIALTTGSNPDCAGHPLTFTAFPINGGSAPLYQWLINGLPVPGADSVTITRYFNHNDTVSVVMEGNSTCSSPYPDSVVSNTIRVSHDSLTALISIMVTKNPICLGTRDTFMATVGSAGLGYSLAWYVDSTLVPLALGPDYGTDSLHDGALVYAILTAPDPCVVNHTTVSNVINMTVISPLPTSAYTVITGGSNPGCLDSPVTFTGHYLNFGTTPSYDWYVNGVKVADDVTTYTSTFFDGDVVTFKVNSTDGGCHTNDTITSPGTLMVRDSTPVTPWLSLIGDLLVVNNGGNYVWYHNSVNSCVGGTIVPGITAQTYNPHTLGYYYVVKDTGNCRSACSNVIYISLLDVKSVNINDVKIYPNPSTGIVNLDWENRIVNMKMDVYNVVGQGLMHADIVDRTHYEADLSYLPEGNYMIVLRDEDGSKGTFKLRIDK